MDVMGVPFVLLAVGVPVAVTVVVILLRLNVLKELLGGFGRPKFSGPPVPGTARISSVQPTGSSIQRGGLPPEYRCRIALRVELPGRPPYDVTIHQLVSSMVLPNLRQGISVAVQVDSANPNNIHVDFNQPVTPAT